MYKFCTPDYLSYEKSSGSELLNESDNIAVFVNIRLSHVSFYQNSITKERNEEIIID
jgi:hypothetical protein